MGQKVKPLRVVLDTNTLVSALVFSGRVWTALRDGWKSGKILPLVCRPTAMELIRVFAYPKFALAKEVQETLLGDFLPHCETVAFDGSKTSLPPCRNCNDQLFLELSLQGQAEYLVTGDKDLLDYPYPVEFVIIPPADFIARL
jgi:putative PIN family toxin of toxin-antitoxin system